MEEKIKKLNEKIELKREQIKLFKELQLMFETGMLNKNYFEGKIKEVTLEHNGLIEAYNIIVKGE